MTSIDAFKDEIRAQIDRAKKQGRPHIEVNAGELHRLIGGYPPKAGEHHSMPTCCEAMRAVSQEHGAAKSVHVTDSGNGAALTIRYDLGS